MRILGSKAAAERLGISQRRVGQLANQIGNVSESRYLAFTEEAVERFRQRLRKPGRPGRIGPSREPPAPTTQS